MADKITLYLGPYRQGKTNVILAKALANITSYGYSNLTYIIVPSQRSADIIKEKLLTLAKTQSIITGFKIQTFYQFCKMLINKLNCPVLICKNDLRLSMLLNGCSQVQTSESDFINLTSGLGKDLLTLIDEFERAFLTPSEILQILAVNFHGNAKFTNLAKIYKCYWDKLNSLKYLDERQLVFQLIQIISQQSNFNLGDIIIDGFDRFNKLQLQFLTQLLPCANNITMSFDYAQSNGFSNNEYQWKQFSYDLISQQYAKYFNIINVNDENNFRLRQLEIYEAFDFNDEISTIARQIKDLIINQQYSLNDILVVVANLKYYTNTIDYIFNDSKIPYYLDDNINLAESSIIKCLINLLTLPLNNFSRLELLNLIKSPFFKTVIFNDVDILDLEIFAQEYLVVESLNEWLKALVNKSHLLEKMVKFSQIFKLPDTKDSFENFAIYVEDLIHTYIIPGLKLTPLTSEQEIISKQAISQFRDCLLSIVQDNLINPLVFEITYENFVRLLLQKVDNRTIHRPKLNRDYILVTSINQAANQAYKYIFIAGLCEEYYPGIANLNSLSSKDELSRWRYCGVSLFNPRHDFTYDYAILKLLIKQSRNYVRLSSPTYDPNGEELMTSSILLNKKLMGEDLADFASEAIIQQNYRLLPKIPLSVRSTISYYLTNNLNLNNIHESKVLNESGDFIEYLNEYRLKPLRMMQSKINDVNCATFNFAEMVWSPSRFNEYGKCPFRYFATYLLKLKPKREPDYQLESSLLGTFYHLVLELLFKQIINLQLNSVEDILHQLDISFNEALAQIEPKIAWSNSNRFQLKKYEYLYRLKRFVTNTYLDTSITKSQPYSLEYAFGEIEPLSINLDQDKVIYIRGKIDRIDKDADGQYVIIDYKTGSAHISTKDIMQGIHTQLPIYALALIAQNQSDCISNGYYLSIGSGKILKQLIAKDVTLDDYLAKTKANLLNFTQSIALGKFPVSPYNADICTSCNYNGICGIKDLSGFTNTNDE